MPTETTRMALTKDAEVSALRALVLAQQRHITTLEECSLERRRIRCKKRTLCIDFLQDGTLEITFYQFYPYKRYVHVYLYLERDLPPVYSKQEIGSEHVTHHVGIKQPLADAYYQIMSIQQNAPHEPCLCFILRARLSNGGYVELDHNLDYDANLENQMPFLTLIFDTFDANAQPKKHILRIDGRYLWANRRYNFSDETKQRFRNTLQQAVDAWGIPQLS